MKDKVLFYFHSTLKVLGRNCSMLLYLVSTVFLLYVFGKFDDSDIVIFPIFLFSVSLIMLIRGVFGLVIDFLDTVLDIPGLSDFRRRCYDKKVDRIKARVNRKKEKKYVLMPFQPSNGTSKSDMMFYDISKIQGRDE